ncbi:unnamed protein product [Orchesella dallaii]|uniref:Uncharacterized protein n=1 Tax=Orchesella dallaii TaxID=48710 RepID=A0ABP1PWY9_9HEXA
MSTNNKARRTPSPSPTVTLDTISQPKIYRSSSEESIRVLHHAVLFPTSPHPQRVTYVRRTVESDSELVKRQLAMIATQPLTFAEDLALKRKQLEIRVEKRKRDKAVAATTPDGKMTVPDITIIPASGKLSPLPPSPTKVKNRASFKEKGNANTKIPKPTPTSPVRIPKPRIPLKNASNKQGNTTPININISKSPIPSLGPTTPSPSPSPIKSTPPSPLQSPKRKPSISIDKK